MCPPRGLRRYGRRKELGPRTGGVGDKRMHSMHKIDILH